jgi:hypothetical protein
MLVLATWLKLGPDVSYQLRAALHELAECGVYCARTTHWLGDHQ